MSDWFNPANDGEAQALEVGVERERKRILNWILDNRTEVTDGVIRDHFTSADLVRFITEGEL
jgi:hypothetical protein